jgi:hypothetical protein
LIININSEQLTLNKKIHPRAKAMGFLFYLS